MSLIDKILPHLPEDELGALSSPMISELMDHSYAVGTLTRALKASHKVSSKLVSFNNIRVRLYWKKPAKQD